MHTNKDGKVKLLDFQKLVVEQPNSMQNTVFL